MTSYRCTLIAIAMWLGGCLQPRTKVCEDVQCPASKVCDGFGGCAFPEQLSACDGQPDATPCSYPGTPAGVCTQQLCLPANHCGNGIVEGIEQCDDGNSFNGDGCHNDCRIPSCGDGVLDAQEHCDEGANNSMNPDAKCRPDCSLAGCGDGIIDVANRERCDDGALNADEPGKCRTNCELPRCGDEILDPAEMCDDGNVVAADGCSADCRSLETCGNGIVDLALGEQCDDGNTVELDACHNDCSLPKCGDGIVDLLINEQCDRGAQNSSAPDAMCRLDCRPPTCGDSVIDPSLGEICDDGNAQSGDGCSVDCRSREICGNGIVDIAIGEQCDDGNTSNGDACHSNCHFPRCGDGILDPAFNEQCDAGAGNSNLHDAACRIDCRLPSCGDGILDPGRGEVCDDGNVIAGDGCRPDCASNETCGNGIVDLATGESCDDGNSRGRDGCSGCRIEDAVVLTPGQTPPNRTDHAMAYDAARQRVVMFGGTAADTWEWDGTSWTQQHPAHAPSTRTVHAMAYDAVRHRVVLFGGVGTNGAFRDDTWLWNGVDWIEAQPLTRPDPTGYHTVAFDSVRGGLILYGGLDSTSGFSTKTWLWDGLTWSQLATTSAGTRYLASMATDPIHKQVVLFGGAGADGHTWTWDGTMWTDRGLAPAGIPTQGRAMAFDATRQRVVLFGSQAQATWEWDGSTWLAVGGSGPPPRDHTAMIYDAAHRQLVLFGGGTGLSDTWLRAGTVWSQPPSWVEPDLRFRSAATYDPLRGRVVLFGGTTDGAFHDGKTWEWEGSRWREIAAITPPTPRSAASLAFDNAAMQSVLVGGETDTGFDSGVYLWNGTTWSLAPGSTTGRIGLRDDAMAYDSIADRIVTLGGRDESTSLNSPATSTWAPGPGWVQQSPSVEPPARRNHAMAFDPLRNRTVMFGGKGDSSFLPGVVWEWNGITWQSFTTPVGPSPRKGFEMVYNPDRRATIVFGNAGVGSEDLWEWNGTWTMRTLDTHLDERYRSSLAYDAARHALVLFGGRDASSANTGRTQIIEYRPSVATEACTSSTLDYDNDGKAGCADDDCWSVCTPLCPPGTSCPPTAPKCGDGLCGSLENCNLCPSDCGACTGGACGDFHCDTGETHASCPNDC